MNSSRKTAIQAVILIICLTFLGKLFYLQVVDVQYKELAEANSLQRVIDYPYRGIIYDRNQQIMVYNVPIYDIMVVPRDLDKNMDTVGLARTLGMTFEDARKELRKARSYSRNRPSVFMKQLSQQDFARVQERLLDFPGFYVNPRTVRAYPHGSSANVLGYIGEISQPRLDKLKAEGDNTYKSGDYIGISGMEKQYEKELRGRRGIKYMLVDVHGATKGQFKGGAFDTSSVRGENITAGLDLELQKLGDTLMQNKTGSIVAIEPATGEILCMVSGPSYDPNMLTGREFSKNYQKLALDIGRPLFNRASQSMYRPGSTFKIVHSLIAMQDGSLGPATTISCHTSPMHCHPHPSPQQLTGGIIYSCNSYFFHVFKRIVNKGVYSSPFMDTRVGLEKWNQAVHTFGFGRKLGVDIPNEKRGRVPTVAYYDKIYGEKRWKFSTIYSISIGEGEFSVNPIQMANFAATIANRGWWITPHLVRKIGNQKPDTALTNRHYTSTAPEHFEWMAGAMEQVVLAGKTVWSKSRIDSVTLCGKTGTSQNARGKDHSIFIGFAPKENPKIAVACFIENAGFGGYAAAPIASLIVERYIKNRIVRKNLKSFMAGKEYLTPIEKEAKAKKHLADSLNTRDSLLGRQTPILLAGNRNPLEGKTVQDPAAPQIKATTPNAGKETKDSARGPGKPARKLPPAPPVLDSIRRVFILPPAADDMA